MSELEQLREELATVKAERDDAKADADSARHMADSMVHLVSVVRGAADRMAESAGVVGPILRQLPPTHCGPDSNGETRHAFVADDDGQGVCQCGEMRVRVERVEVW